MDVIAFAAEKHRDQRRKDQHETPYINHPIGVAMILYREAGISDEDILKAAILHDTVEDTETTFVELEKHFGSVVTSYVREKTDDKTLSKIERKRFQIEHAPNASYGAKLIGLADKIYNLRDLSKGIPVGWDSTRVHEYFVWAKQVCEGYGRVDRHLWIILDDLFKDI